MTHKGKRNGWTISELLIVVAVVSILMVLALLVGWRRQISRGYDAKRKDDLETIKIVFEEYYNDHRCYPLETILNNCAGPELKPYLDKIPCDPVTRQPYKYVPLADDPCRGYRVLTGLENATDPDITRLGCNGPQACGFGPYNYGISSGTPVAASGLAGSTPTPTPTPTPVPGTTPTPTPQLYFACTPQGVCNVYADPIGMGCPVTYPEGTCANACGDPANRCAK